MGRSYLHTLVSMVPTAANASYYAEIVSERAVLRRMVDGRDPDRADGVRRPRATSHDLVDRAQAEVYDLTSGRTSEDYSPLRDIFDGTLNEIEAIASHGGQMVGVPTGFADLDALTNGLHAGQLIIIAARPAIGKSTLGLDLARSASIRNGLTSVIFSLEMARNEIVMRLMSAEAQVPLAHMRSGTMSDADWQKLARKSGRDRRGADVHRRLAEHVDDGDPGQVPAAEAEARPAAGDRGLPAAHEFGARRWSPASRRSRSSPGR